MQNKLSFWFILTTLVLLFFPDTAFAQVFDIPANDKSKEIIIDNLFGPLTRKGGVSPLGPLVEVFNGAILVVGGILLAYTLVAGTMSTAHDGEMLGKKWSSLWIPIRTSMGTAAIIPIPGLQGFCFAQVIVVWLAMQSIGLADAIWERFVMSQTDSLAATYVPPKSSNQIREVLESMVKSSACVYAGDTQARKSSAETHATLGTYASIETKVMETQIKYGPSGECGKIIISPNELPKGAMTGSNAAFFNTATLKKSLFEVHAQQVKAAHPETTKLAKLIVDKQMPDEQLRAHVNLTLNALAENWSRALQDRASSVYASSVNTNLMKKIVDEGWMMAGMWYMQFAKVQDAISQGVTTVPVAQNSPYLSGIGGLFGPIDVPQATDAIARATEVISTGKSYGKNAVTEFADDNEAGLSNKIIKWFINDDTPFDGIESKLHENPVVMAVNLGNSISTWAWGAFITATTAASGVNAFGGLIDKLPVGNAIASGLSTAITMVSPMILGVASTLIVSGAMLSTYIPLLPYILWVGVVLGWAITLIEAVIAAPLWAVIHLAPDGDGVVGRGGQGYMLVLGLTLRPALMVIGFAAAVILMNPLGYFINSTFYGAFFANVNPSMLSLVKLVTGVVLYVVLTVSVITRVFALIHVVPDRLLRWIGGGASNDLGQEAHGIEGMTQNKAMAGVMAMNSIQQAGMQASQALGNKRASEDGKRSQNASNFGDAAREFSKAEKESLQAEQMQDKAASDPNASDGDRQMADRMRSQADGNQQAAGYAMANAFNQMSKKQQADAWGGLTPSQQQALQANGVKPPDGASDNSASISTHRNSAPTPPPSSGAGAGPTGSGPIPPPPPPGGGPTGGSGGSPAGGSPTPPPPPPPQGNSSATSSGGVAARTPVQSAPPPSAPQGSGGNPGDNSIRGAAGGNNAADSD